MEISEILTVKSYSETLSHFEQGEVKKYRLTGIDYNGFHNAKSRLTKKGIIFDLKYVEEQNNTYFIIKRIK